MTPQAATCQQCGASMQLRRNRSTGASFLGCCRYPSCKSTQQYDEVLGELMVENLSLRNRLEARINRQRPTVQQSLDKELKALAFKFHPDRAGTSVATHEVMIALNSLRSRVEVAT